MVGIRIGNLILCTIAGFAVISTWLGVRGSVFEPIFYNIIGWGGVVAVLGYMYSVGRLIFAPPYDDHEIDLSRIQ